MPLPLCTPRLVLRPFADRDLDQFVTYRSDPAVARYQGWDAPYPLEKAMAFVAEMKSRAPGIPGEWLQLALELRADGAMVGDCAFQVLPDDPHQAQIAFTLARARWGLGLAAEAGRRLLDYLFGELGLHRVRAVCDAENDASARLLQRLGMRREGHFGENVWFKGAWASEYLYAMLEKEWVAQRPSE